MPRNAGPVTPAYFQRQVAKGVSEAELSEWVVALAQAHGWEVRYVGDSRLQHWEGMPDLCLWHQGRGLLIWAELKTEKGTLSLDRITKSGVFCPGQEETIASLRAAGQVVYIWRPSTWVSGEIERVLGKPATPTP